MTDSPDSGMMARPLNHADPGAASRHDDYRADAHLRACRACGGSGIIVDARGITLACPACRGAQVVEKERGDA